MKPRKSSEVRNGAKVVFFAGSRFRSPVGSRVGEGEVKVRLAGRGGSAFVTQGKVTERFCRADCR